ncbi:HAD family hydrolase [Georgenia deserti]|uniref:HAD family hydrolase n=1 Tax=Georgenia deserti TaxID=2093781 RepID=A0ABW4L395_9MICO
MSTIETTPAISPDRRAPGLRTRPEVLLLDFGGVVFATRRRAEGMTEVAERVSSLLAHASHEHHVADLVTMLEGGKRALGDWKNSQSRRREPTELDHRTIWRDFYGAPLPLAQRELLAGHAEELQMMMTLHLTEHSVRPGIVDLLGVAANLGIPVGIVSNTHSGRAHRAVLDRSGLTDRFAVQVYSDEVGVRKPHPGIIALAARALGTTASSSWYVGDTFDRDVVAGRRAGVAAVVLTRHHKTDHPPFPVAERADLVLDDPRGLVPLLEEASPTRPSGPARSRADASARDLTAAAGSRPPSALLLDHGGVISTSQVDTAGLQRFAALLAGRLTAAGHPTSPREAARALAAARRGHKQWKQAHETTRDGVVPEIDPATFWADLVAPALPGLPEAVAAWMRAESHDLMYFYARAKSVRTIRPGVAALLERAARAGVPVGIVSNTVSGRAVRAELDRLGVLDLIAAHAYSDEVGRRKPDPAGVHSVLTALDADPAQAWFVGDKPHRDVPAARRAGVGTVVLVRGGSTPDDTLDRLVGGAPSEQLPDHVITEMTELLDLALPHSRV